MDNQSISRVIQDVYRQLMARYGPQHWWPAPEPFEVIVGAILTQSAAWTNVAKAIANLKSAEALSPYSSWYCFCILNNGSRSATTNNFN